MKNKNKNNNAFDFVVFARQNRKIKDKILSQRQPQW